MNNEVIIRGINKKNNKSRLGKKTLSVTSQNTIRFLVFIFLLIGLGSLEAKLAEYSMDGIVFSVSATEILIEDTTGNVWAVNDNSLQLNDEVSLTFFTNGTDSDRKDDEIIKIERLDKDNKR